MKKKTMTMKARTLSTRSGKIGTIKIKMNSYPIQAMSKINPIQAMSKIKIWKKKNDNLYQLNNCLQQ